VAQLFNPHHRCSVCDQPTENTNLCDSCTDRLKRYEADMYSKLEPRTLYHNE
jgi:predicted amidophosphoribosyltransferase